MKDKLHKNNHRGVYYKVKTFFFVFVLFASAMAVAVIPTYIVIKDSAEQSTKAEPEVVEVEETEQSEESEEATPLSYQQ